MLLPPGPTEVDQLPIPGLDAEATALLSPQDRALLSRLEPPQPWDQQPGETPSQYAAFLLYRDLGPGRTIKETIRRWLLTPTMGNGAKITARSSVGTIKLQRAGHEPVRLPTWARENSWQVRAELYDQEMGRRAQRLTVDRLRRLKNREAQIVDKAYDKIENYVDLLKEEDLSPRDLAPLLSALSRLLRMSADEPEHLVDGNITHQVVQISNEEINDRLAQLAAKGQGRAALIEQLADDAAGWTDSGGTGGVPASPAAPGGTGAVLTAEYREAGGE